MSEAGAGTAEDDPMLGEERPVDWRHAVAESRPWFTRGVLWTLPMVIFYAIV